MRSSVSIALLSMLCLTGCPTDDPTTEDAGDARVELGTGFDAFESVDDGGPWELVMGPQGGWHLDMSLLMYVADPDGIRLSYEVRNGLRDRLTFDAPYEVRRSRVEDAGDHFIRLRDRAIFDISSADEVVGVTVTVSVRAVTPAGDELTDQRRAVVVDDEP